jgi:hypothetical protein
LELRLLIDHFLAYGLYPVWLLAGAGDYVCHRRSDMARTSGLVEARLHVAQFITVAIVFFGAVLWRPTMWVVVVIGIAALAHLVLSYIDVTYTQQRRHISAFEQHMHAFMDVIPIMVVCLLALIGLSDPLPAPTLRAFEDGWKEGLLIGSFLVLAGGPLIEEYVRTAKLEKSSARDSTVAREVTV